MKLSIKDFFSKCMELLIWSHLLKKSLMENFIFCQWKQKALSYGIKDAQFNFIRKSCNWQIISKTNINSIKSEKLFKVTSAFKNFELVKRFENTRRFYVDATYLLKCWKYKKVYQRFNPHMHETFLQRYCMKWVPEDPLKEVIN